MATEKSADVDVCYFLFTMKVMKNLKLQALQILHALHGNAICPLTSSHSLHTSKRVW